jgi:hypothetical protein
LLVIRDIAAIMSEWGLEGTRNAVRWSAT